MHGYAYKILISLHAEGTGVTEITLSNIGNTPLVTNPIYESGGGGIYEEILDLKNLKSLSRDKEGEEIQPMSEREEAYAVISTPGIVNTNIPKLHDVSQISVDILMS